MLLGNLDSVIAPITLMKPMSLGLDGVCILDEQGHETPITQDMIVRACEDLLQRMSTRLAA